MSDITLYDLKGLKCPLPVLKTRRRLATMQRGEELSVETTDPLAVIDVPHFCNEDGHQLIETVKLDNGHRFRIRKG
ncbi:MULTISPECIES: sulfurtransferase TusA family protein [Alphaproteobacteria]|uniref:Transcriptional regulator n=2 Tax=Alphaproteobacteria TaxID=28211 RepID=A0A512HLF7_9HYPH|nr:MULTISPECIES: sulfurtransferase TusA family protein [Alphaproteobacteria]GEO86288.1 transcriptional regulator [Ciceribacter naphthalenivorans]GLR21770.1 transcriptional regulator [Ciceribacter naphthalenivorans]GLT04626.1 transcriptional regulator [Sphingomonas psychrolutea]